MDKMKAATTDARIDEHNYRPGISVELSGVFDVGTPKVWTVWATARRIFVRYIFAMANDVTAPSEPNTDVYDLGVDSDRFRRLDLDASVVDEKEETLRAMELVTRMG